MANTNYMVIREAEGAALFGETFNTRRVMGTYDNEMSARRCILRLIEDSRAILEDDFNRNMYDMPALKLEGIREGEYVASYSYRGKPYKREGYFYVAF